MCFILTSALLINLSKTGLDLRPEQLAAEENQRLKEEEKTAQHSFDGWSKTVTL